jgi:hypothetical protein
MSNQTPPPPPPSYGAGPMQYGREPKKKHRVRNILLSIVGVFVIIGAIGAATGGGKDDKTAKVGSAPVTTKAVTAAPTTPAASPSSANPSIAGAEASLAAIEASLSALTNPSASAPAPTTAAPTTTKPKPAPTTTKPKPKAPTFTVSQQSAMDEAQSYLDTIGGFSRKALIGQLSSTYGAGFSRADATFAVDHLKIDYNAEALQAAKSYMESIGGFSRAGLISQLTSSFGAQFTLAQATYAVNKIGL